MFYDQAGYEQPQVDAFSIDKPGDSVELPSYIIRELQNIWGYKRRLPFLGGHPVSITKESCNAIFSTLVTTTEGLRVSPYLVCEKTDGVRYLLIVAKVGQSDLHRQKGTEETAPFTECFFISRQGLGKPIAYSADVAISHHLEPASMQIDREKRQVIQILDGELIKQANGHIRFLIFDALIHLGKDICDLKLRERLDCVVNFMHCNNMLGVKKHKIQLRLKDFFRLSCIKFNISEFMMNKYVKCLPHQNDGLIFNHQQKEYIRASTNNGYIKWKPAHLNTVDFMIVPNQNLQQALGKRVLDLYLAYQDVKLQRYTRQFYSFAVVSEQTYDQIFATHQDKLMKYADKQMEMHYENEETILDQFNSSCIIAECRFQGTKMEERTIMSQLVKHSDEDLYSNIMKQGEQKKDRQAIKQFKNKMYDKGWKIYKLRIDKTLPNNIEVTKKIEQSIRDGITQDEILKKNKQLMQKVKKGGY